MNRQHKEQPTAVHKTAVLVYSNAIRHWKSIYHMKDAQTPWKERAKEQNAERILEGVGKIPVLPEIAAPSATKEPLKEGWALKQTKRPYRFNDKQNSYLVSKFNIGQDLGQQLQTRKKTLPVLESLFWLNCSQLCRWFILLSATNKTCAR